MNLAIIQNSIGIGGRSKVIAQIVKLFLDEANKIEIFTLSPESEHNKFRNYFKLDSRRLNINGLRGNFVPGTIYQQPYLNFRISRKLNDYKIVFNSNNSFAFLPDGPRYIHYIHCPNSLTTKIDSKYQLKRYKVAAAPYEFFSSYTNPDISGDVLTNSNFISKLVKSEYQLDDTTVIYPPAIPDVEFSGFSGEGVVSLGSFHRNKRQLFQIKVAESMPSLDFKIIGRVQSFNYFNKCKKYIADNNVSNVELIPDASTSLVDEIMDSSLVFLHSMKSEHFGISIVEGMNSGCIPVVHDSGGPKEIMPDKRFRYNSKIECIKAIELAFSAEEPSIPSIPDHLSQFTKRNFNSSLRDKLC